MSGLPWYKRDPTDFLDGCARGNLTLEEVGAYAILIDEMYRRGGPLTDEPRHGAALIRSDVRVWYRLRASLIRKGKIYATSGGYISNLRVEKELREQHDMREQKARAGRLSAQSKADAALANAQLRCNSSVTEAELSRTDGAKRLETNDSASTPVGSSVGVDKDIEKEEDRYVGASAPTSIDEPIKEAVEAYNEAARRAGWTVAKTINAKRRRLIRARLRKAGIDGWREQIAEAETQPFLAGVGGNRDWRMDLEFFASERGAIAILEGKYRRAGQTPPPTPIDQAADRRRVFLETGIWNPAWGDEPTDLFATGARP